MTLLLVLVLLILANCAGALPANPRLLDLVDDVSDRSAHAIADALFDAVDRFGVGRPQDDDQTLVVIKGAAA